MLREIWQRWQRRSGPPAPSFSRSPLFTEGPSDAAVTRVQALFKEQRQPAALTKPPTFQGLVIRRVPGGGWCLHTVLGGNAWYCGADRRWVFDLADIGSPFKTFHGVEWYLQEWKVVTAQ